MKSCAAATGPHRHIPDWRSHDVIGSAPPVLKQTWT